MTRFSMLRVIGLIAVIGAFYLATIRDGHVWGDDWAAYVHQAKNIVEGRPCGDIGYIRSPSSINPLAYPPGFPLLLAPVYRVFGFDLTAMKVMCVGFFCLALLLLYRLLQEAGRELALATVAIIGFCPYFWDFKDTLYSEFPFLAFAYAALLAAHRAVNPSLPSRLQTLWGLAAGVLGGFAYWIRGPGIVLLPAMVLANYVTTRRWCSRLNLATVGAFAGMAVAQKVLFHVKEDYLTPLLGILSVHSLLASPWYYFRCLAVPWDNGYSTAAQWVVYLALATLAVYGAVRRIWGDKTGAGSARGPRAESGGSPDFASDPSTDGALGNPSSPASKTAQPDTFAPQKGKPTGTTGAGAILTESSPSAGLRPPSAPVLERDQVRRTAPANLDASPSPALRAHLPEAGISAWVSWEQTRALRCLLAGRWTVLEIFTLLYLMFIVLFPWGGRRYLMPIMPLFVFYALVGAAALGRRWSTRRRLALHVGLALAVAATFLARYTTLSWRQTPGGIRTPGFAELVEYLKAQGNAPGPLVFFKARLLAFYTGAKAADVFQTKDSEKFFEFYRQIGASRFVVLKHSDEPANRFLCELIAGHPNRFVLERETGDFQVYRCTEAVGR
jgi:hypothetical protein